MLRILQTEHVVMYITCHLGMRVIGLAFTESGWFLAENIHHECSDLASLVLARIHIRSAGSRAAPSKRMSSSAFQDEILRLQFGSILRPVEGAGLIQRLTQLLSEK